MIRTFIAGAVIAGAATISLGFDPSPFPPLLSDGASDLVSAIGMAGASMMPAAPANAAASAPLSALKSAKPWLNASPLGAEDLRGKVVLVNFWTYSCINSLRPLPYLRAWAEKYRERGLVVIGVHAPEFGFERDAGNVRRATAMNRVNYPVALDGDLAIWRAFGNEGWPGFYFIDAGGRIRRHTVGEGGYAGAERLIQRLLGEIDGAAADQAIAEVSGEGAQAAPDWGDLRSPETYIGYDQARMFASPGGVKKDVSNSYAPPPALSLNQWSLVGDWTAGGEFATLDAPPGGIRYRFHARDLHLVLAAAADGRPIRFRVTIDGAAPGADRGSDVDAEGWGTLREDRLYQLVRQSGPVRDRTFEIEFSERGARAYAFTFG
jgi:thiol-disulfide isomerase/thioredoxin